jgi:transcriptional regulator with XRE-family HTH domain
MSALSRIFNHNRNPSIESAEKIAEALRMGLEEFLIGLRGHVRHYKSSGGNRNTRSGKGKVKDAE